LGPGGPTGLVRNTLGPGTATFGSLRGRARGLQSASLKPPKRTAEGRAMGYQDHLRPVVARRRSVSGRLTLLVAGLALAATACIPPAPAPGLQNGFLSDSVLQTINANCKIWKPAAPSLLNMSTAAHSVGVELTPESC